MPVVATPDSSLLVPVHLRRGGNTDVELEIFGSVAALDSRTRKRPIDVVLVELMVGPPSSLDLIRELRATHQQLPIVAVVRALTADRDLVPSAIAAGVTDMVLLGYEDLLGCVRRLCAVSTKETIEEELLRLIMPRVDPPARPFIAYALRTAAERLSADQFANAFGMSRPTLARQLRRRTGFSSVTSLMAAGRAAWAVLRLQQPAARVATVADELGFATTYAFRHFFRNQLGLRPCDVRGKLGIEIVVEQFLLRNEETDAPNAAARLRAIDRSIGAAVRKSDRDELDIGEQVVSAWVKFSAEAK